MLYWILNSSGAQVKQPNSVVSKHLRQLGWQARHLSLIKSSSHFKGHWQDPNTNYLEIVDWIYELSKHDKQLLYAPPEQVEQE